MLKGRVKSICYGTDRGIKAEIRGERVQTSQRHAPVGDSVETSPTGAWSWRLSRNATALNSTYKWNKHCVRRHRRGHALKTINSSKKTQGETFRKSPVGNSPVVPCPPSRTTARFIVLLSSAWHWSEFQRDRGRGAVVFHSHTALQNGAESLVGAGWALLVPFARGSSWRSFVWKRSETEQWGNGVKRVQTKRILGNTLETNKASRSLEPKKHEL